MTSIGWRAGLRRGKLRLSRAATCDRSDGLWPDAYPERLCRARGHLHDAETASVGAAFGDRLAGARICAASRDPRQCAGVGAAVGVRPARQASHPVRKCRGNRVSPRYRALSSRGFLVHATRASPKGLAAGDGSHRTAARLGCRGILPSTPSRRPKLAMTCLACQLWTNATTFQPRELCSSRNITRRGPRPSRRGDWAFANGCARALPQPVGSGLGECYDWWACECENRPIEPRWPPGAWRPGLGDMPGDQECDW